MHSSGQTKVTNPTFLFQSKINKTVPQLNQYDLWGCSASEMTPSSSSHIPIALIRVLTVFFVIVWVDPVWMLWTDWSFMASRRQQRILDTAHRLSSPRVHWSRTRSLGGTNCTLLRHSGIGQLLTMRIATAWATRLATSQLINWTSWFRPSCRQNAI